MIMYSLSLKTTVRYKDVFRTLYAKLRDAKRSNDSGLHVFSSMRAVVGGIYCNHILFIDNGVKHNATPPITKNLSNTLYMNEYKLKFSIP